MVSIGICIAENKIMKPIILFASAICIALFGVLAFYHEPLIWVGGMVLIVWVLAGAYVPKLRVWCGLFCVVVILPACFAATIYNIYSDGILSFLAGSGGGVFGGLAAWYAHGKGRVEMKKSGLPSWPGDENKSDEELKAEEDELNVIRHLKRFWNRGK